MTNNDMVCAGVNATQYLLLASQANATLQTIQLVLSIASTVLILGCKLYDWFKKAKKDGKIDKEELKEGINIVKDGVEELSKKIDKGDKN